MTDPILCIAEKRNTGEAEEFARFQWQAHSWKEIPLFKLIMVMPAS